MATKENLKRCMAKSGSATRGYNQGDPWHYNMATLPQDLHRQQMATSRYRRPTPLSLQTMLPLTILTLVPDLDLDFLPLM